MIGQFGRGTPPGTDAASILGMVRVAGDVDDLAVIDTHIQPAAHVALSAQGRNHAVFNDDLCRMHHVRLEEQFQNVLNNKIFLRYCQDLLYIFFNVL